jgi:protocatechuate 3,4-dioxygenase beta subunit
MHDDDALIGRILSRREAMAVLGGITGATAFGVATVGVGVAQSPSASVPPATSPGAGGSPGAAASPPAPSCIVRPEVTEGPYYVDNPPERSDIRTDSATGSVSEGLPLRLAWYVSRLDGSTCTAYEGVVVDVWHCDAAGVYSGVKDPGFDTSGLDYLRGYQLTDANGHAAFTTIYPGWYSGRCVHIHFKVRTDPSADQGFEFTSQLFFSDEQSAEVFTREPYAARGLPDVLNDQDAIYRETGGQTLLTVVADGDGYAATFEIGIQVT